MNNTNIKNQQGSITILMVFFTMIVMFLFVFSNNVTATREKIISRNSITTEKAFYSAQTCIEEGYLQLRTDENYSGTSIAIPGVECNVVSIHNAGEVFGKLVGTGTSSESIRTVASYYADAGGSSSINETTIYHIMDRSGTMIDDGLGCTISGFADQASCENNGGVWGYQPITSAKEAAKSFINELDPAYDKIGVAYYSDSARCDFLASNDFVGARTAIDDIASPSGYTNIGDAIGLATANILNNAPPTDTRVEILLTDGKANRPLPLATSEDYARTKADEADSAGILIFTIGLGSNVNVAFLRDDIATDPTMYFYAPSAAELENIYNQIANAIVSYNISQSGWLEE
ncbi:MAG: VWA domain-containing protein [Patescibacteria group bacterium]